MTPAEDAPSWARQVDGGWRLDVRVQPGARVSSVVGALGTSLKIKVAAPADAGRANAALVRFVADALGVPNRSVRIVRGGSSRSKIVSVDAPVPLSTLRRALAGK